MACRISELVIKCRDPRRLAAFWCEVLGFGARPADVGQTRAEPWHVLADPEGNEFCLLESRPT
jgi:glyoxalase superfamily protein